MKVGLLVLLLSSCAKDVPMPPHQDPVVHRRYLSCTAGLGDEFFDSLPKRYRHQAHRIAAECLEFHNQRP